MSLLRHAIVAFCGHPRIAEVLAAIRPEDRAAFDNATAGLRALPPVAGGETRQDSVRLGLEALSACRPDYVLIHDGARPFPDAALIGRVIDGLDRAPAAIPCLPLSDTVKRVEDGAITGTVDRDRAVAGADAARFSLRPNPRSAPGRRRAGADR